jgi:hypothetical protein
MTFSNLVSQQPATTIVVRNNSNQAIPSFSVIEILSVDTNGHFTVSAPTIDGGVNGLCFTGPGVILPNSVGQATIASPVSVGFSRDNFGGEGPVAGECWGVRAGSYELHKGFSGFVALRTASSLHTVGLFSCAMSKPVELIRVTSSVKVQGRYPAKRCSYNPVDDTLTDIEDVWFVDLNE